MFKFIILLIFLASNFNCFSKSSNDTVFMGDGFRKITKKREISQSQKSKRFYYNKYNEFIRYLSKKTREEITNEIRAADPIKWSKENQRMSLSAGEYYQNNAFAVSFKILTNDNTVKSTNRLISKDEYTYESVNRVIEFWEKKKPYNSDFWIDTCKKIHKKEVQQDKIKKRHRNLACNYYPGESNVIFNF